MDGNKRTTLLLLHTLLVRSGYQLRPATGENINQAIEEMILGVVNRTLLLDECVSWLRARIHKA
jgi:prophage maintenance system killer protein